MSHDPRQQQPVTFTKFTFKETEPPGTQQKVVAVRLALHPNHRSATSHSNGGYLFFPGGDESYGQGPQSWYPLQADGAAAWSCAETIEFATAYPLGFNGFQMDTAAFNEADPQAPYVWTTVYSGYSAGAEPNSFLEIHVTYSVPKGYQLTLKSGIAANAR